MSTRDARSGTVPYSPWHSGMALVTVAGRSGADTSPLGPDLGAPFTIEHNSYSFGQAASGAANGTVLSGQ